MFRKLLSSAAALAVLGLLGFAQFASADDACDAGCGKTKCESVTETKIVKVHCYTSTCEEMCLCKGCLLQGLFKGWWPPQNYCGCNSGACAACDAGCDCAGCDKCSHPINRKFLVVKIKAHEETVRKCVPTCCATGCAAPAAVVPAPKAPEVIPAPKPADGKGVGEVLMIEEGAPGVAHTMPTR